MQAFFAGCTALCTLVMFALLDEEGAGSGDLNSRAIKAADRAFWPCIGLFLASIGWDVLLGEWWRKRCEGRAEDEKEREERERRRSSAIGLGDIYGGSEFV